MSSSCLWIGVIMAPSRNVLVVLFCFVPHLPVFQVHYSLGSNSFCFYQYWSVLPASCKMKKQINRRASFF